MPILRERRDLNAETPMNLQIENPPRFMTILFLLSRIPASFPENPAKAHHLPSARRQDSD
jgi:hypothetical protein